jgi:hypothetical protein
MVRILPVPTASCEEFRVVFVRHTYVAYTEWNLVPEPIDGVMCPFRGWDGKCHVRQVS